MGIGGSTESGFQAYFSAVLYAGAGSAAADAGHYRAALGLDSAQLGHALQSGADILGVG